MQKIDFAPVESCSYCIHCGKIQICEPEFGVCAAYIDKRYVSELFDKKGEQDERTSPGN